MHPDRVQITIDLQPEGYVALLRGLNASARMLLEQCREVTPSAETIHATVQVSYLLDEIMPTEQDLMGLLRQPRPDRA